MELLELVVILLFWLFDIPSRVKARGIFSNKTRIILRVNRD